MWRVAGGSNDDEKTLMDDHHVEPDNACFVLSKTSRSSPASSLPPRGQGNSRTYNFDSDTPGKMPAGFHSALTGKGKEGTWLVKQDDTAPSKPNVLAQTASEKTDYHLPLCIADEGSYRDLDLRVKIKA